MHCFLCLRFFEQFFTFASLETDEDEGGTTQVSTQFELLIQLWLFTVTFSLKGSCSNEVSMIVSSVHLYCEFNCSWVWGLVNNLPCSSLGSCLGLCLGSLASTLCCLVSAPDLDLLGVGGGSLTHHTVLVFHHGKLTELPGLTG